MSDDNEEAKNSKVIGQGWGLSIAVVIAIIGCVAANLRMYSNLDTNYAKLDVQMGGFTDDLKEIKSAILTLTTATHNDIREIRKDNASTKSELLTDLSKLRERITVLEAKDR